MIGSASGKSLRAALIAGLCWLVAGVVNAPAAETQVQKAASAGEPIRLGAAISLTGKYSANGMHTRNGYNIAVERVNAMGGVTIDGVARPIEVVYYDDESTPARGAQLVERLIEQDGVRLILGPYSSGLTKAIAPVTEKYRVPMIEANGAARELFTQGYKYLFAVISTSEQYLRPAIDLAAEEARKAGRDPSTLRVAGVFENDNFSQDVRAGVIDDARRYGMTLVIDDKLPPELNDMSSSLARVKAERPDLLLVSGHDKGAALAIRQIAEMRVNVPMLAMTHCDSAQIIRKFGRDAEYALCGAQWAPTLPYGDPWFGSARQFAADFEDRYGYFPPYQAAESAAAVLVFADAIARAGSAGPQAVRDAIADTDLMTLYGRVRFDETGKNIGKPMVLYQVQEGEYRVVAPTRFAEVPLVHPIPRWQGETRGAPGDATAPRPERGAWFEGTALGLDLVTNGILFGAIFALVAFGMALVWGVMNIVNIVQGEFVILGGYVTWALVEAGLSPMAGLPVSAATLFIVGWLAYRAVIFRLVDRDMFISILATFGLSILLQQLMNEAFGADVRTVDAGLGMAFLMGGLVTIAHVKLLALGLAGAVGAGLWVFLKRARLGQAIRATAQNARAARILGIDTDRVYAATYALNAALCGAAGSLVVMAWTIHPYIGLQYTVRSFMVVVVAGIGNVGGVIAAGLGLGALENVAGFILGAEYQVAFVFVLMVAILVWRNLRLRRRREYLS